MLHLDIKVQPQERVRGMLDPSGHPFCLSRDWPSAKCAKK